MIKVRRHKDAAAESMSLAEFEARARAGDIAPQHEVCFPVVTGTQFQRAADLEIYRGLYEVGNITFRRYFHLGRMPWFTLALIAGLIAIHYFWQEGIGYPAAELSRQGAKDRTLMVELGQWWRLFSANGLHVSAWHLGVNALFLLNLGGPAEAVYRRVDYLSILLASALGTTIVSTAMNPVVSCGASGIVFGAWAAVAVFGLRYRELLPKRYRRYFMFGVVPYAVFALYLGFAMDGVDNWGHFGGLLGGALAAAFFPARLLQPQDPMRERKLVAGILVIATVAMGSYFPAGPGDLTYDRYFAKHGLRVAVPQSWYMSIAERQNGREAYVFQNDARVSVGIETRLADKAISLDALAQTFLENQLAGELEQVALRGLRVSELDHVKLSDMPAVGFAADIVTTDVRTRSQFWFMVRGNYRYIINLSAPIWLAHSYAELFEEILDNLDFPTPEAEISAARRQKIDPNAHHLARWALEIGRGGDHARSEELFSQALKDFPQSPEPRLYLLRAAFEREGRAVAVTPQPQNGDDDPLGLAATRPCQDLGPLLRAFPVGTAPWIPQTLATTVEFWRDCGEPAKADALLLEALSHYQRSTVLLDKQHTQISISGAADAAP